jgi:glycosyltransferase involved in cell wall biosynthesis
MNSQALPATPPIRLCAVVPVYNEIDTIETIIARLEQISVVHQIVVVDDGSRDGTRDVVRRMADEGRVAACLHERNCGKGAALRSGLALVREEYLVIQDADLEYDPSDFHAMVVAQQRTGAQVVYGSRFMGGRRSGMLWTHYLGNRGLTLVFNLLFRQWITDMETCYKLFRTDLLRRVGIDNDRFDVDPELTAKVVRAGQRIVEIPVSYTGRPYHAGKKIKPRDGVSAIQTLLAYRSWRPHPVEEPRPAPVGR